ncbi:restriction endonuclease subunit S [Thermopolyspora sp. NPDC052614]|uniref:restriction endonuclease subunit S n=1 Tax=Thermopolyspora sp. NPDC052614 TaxID=3155682 RepID=UPI0034302E6C
MSDWETFLLGNVTVNYDARRVPVAGADRRPGPYPYYGASGVVDYVDGYLFDGDYLLISEDGENLRTRKTPIAFMVSGKFWVNNHAHVVQGNEYANTRYLSYVLSGTDISGYITGSTQPKLTRSALDRITIRLPERSYQDAVVEVLGAIDDKIAVNGLAIATSKKLLQAKFDGLRCLDGGRVTELRHIIELKYGKALKVGDRVHGKVPVYGGNGVSGLHDFALVEGPGIIIGRKGANAGSVSWSQEGFWPIDTAFYVSPLTEVYPMEFLFFLLGSVDLRGRVGDSAIPGLNRDAALSLKVELPSVEVACAFTEFSRPLMGLQHQLARESESLAELRDTLLPKLISGQVRVRDAEKLAEEAT